MNITVLTDSPKSWFIPYGQRLCGALNALGHIARYVHHKDEVLEGDVCFLLSCVKLVNADILQRNKNNIVVHASDLPQGKGFSPLQWQILEGRDEIVLSLFEVVEKVDAGPVYLKDTVTYTGYELLPELRQKMAEKILDMCLEFIRDHERLSGTPQTGKETFYRRRASTDDELDPDCSLREQFQLLRIADNEAYPLYFNLDGRRYTVKIYAVDNESGTVRNNN